MIRVETSGERVTVYLNDYPVIIHTPDNPFVLAGKGTYDTTSVVYGQISDQLVSRAPLTKAQFDHGRSVIRLSGGEFSLSLLISEVDGHLKLIPQRATTGLNRIWLNFNAKPNQGVFGCGAQYNSINHRGQRIPLWVRDRRTIEPGNTFNTLRIKGESTNPSTYPMPFFFTEAENSPYCWYCFDCRNPAFLNFRSAKEHEVELWELPSAITIGVADTPELLFKEIAKKLGKQPILPSWVYSGAQLEISGGSEMLMGALQLISKSSASISSISFRDWSGQVKALSGKKAFYDWHWNQELYPQLNSVIHELYSKGIHSMAYVNPMFSIEGQLFAEASINGFLIKKPQGGNYITDMGGFMTGQLDLTNKSAVRWFKAVLKQNIIDLGFSGYYADLGNTLPPNAVLHSGESAITMRNVWASLWAQLNRDMVLESGKASDIFLYSQTGWIGSNASSLCASTGDHHTSWSKTTGLPSALTAALSLSCSGMAASLTDIGGNISYLGNRSKELLMRWIDYSAFTPIMRISTADCSTSEKTVKNSWQITSDEETLKHFSSMTRLHAGLAPYLRAIIKDSAIDGIPLMRPLFLQFPEIKAYRYVHDAYMLGSELLVAPSLVHRQRNRKVYLPEGHWNLLWGGRHYPAGEHTVPTPIGKPPVFYKADGRFAEVFSSLNNV